MGRLTTLKRDLGSIEPRVKVHHTEDTRITGRRLVERRMQAWTDDPHCARCGKITQYPYGFELDHIIPLHKGGPDTPDNCQILCIDEPGREGCHTIKTREDIKQ